jgi:hypothetical protein
MHRQTVAKLLVRDLQYTFGMIAGASVAQALGAASSGCLS